LSEEQQQQILNLNSTKENQSSNSQVQKEKGKKKTVNEKSFDAVKCKLYQEEQLILEVEMRPALWDFTLPLQERNKAIKMKLWAEVSVAMKGCLTPEGAKKKFKSLVDTYRNIIRNEKCPSGSARKGNGSKWPHYYSMEFLRNHMSPRETSSNCEADEQLDSPNELFEDNSSCNTNKKKPRKRQSSSTENDILCESFNKVAEAISASSSQIILPPPPTMTEIDSCLNVIGCRLKKIPEMYQSKATHKIC